MTRTQDLRLRFGLAVTLSASLLTVACAVSPRSTASPLGTLEAVSWAEGARNPKDEAIERALGAQQEMLRVAGLRALARIGSSDGVDLARALIGDEDPVVAVWAVYALGQMGGPLAQASLEEAAGGASSAPAAALLALGRAGTTTAATHLGPYLKADAADVRAAAAIGLGLLAKRHGKTFPTDRFLTDLTALTRDPATEVRFGAVYALMRFGSPAASIALIPALGDGDAEIRSHAARGLGAAGAAPAVLDAVLNDPDWRVRVEAARALGLVGSSTKSATSMAGSRLQAMAKREVDRLKSADALASGVATQVILEVLDAALKLGEQGDRARAAISEGFGALPAPPAGAALDRARIACALAFGDDAREGTVRRVRTCADASYLAWRRFELEAALWARRGDAGVDSLLQLAIHTDARVRTAAVDALGRIETDRALAARVQLLVAPDPFVVSGAAGTLGAPLAAGARPSGVKEALSTALGALHAQEDPSLVVSVIDAIAALGPDGASFLPALTELDRDPRAAVRRRAADARSAITGQVVLPSAAKEADPTAAGELASGRIEVLLKTSRGDVRLVLFGEVAPRTVGVVQRLIAAGFYDQKTFHRVVPNFVAQGGCPRGDGWGGPGRAVLDETSPLPFARGAIGIATAGRDTGGSQLFIMHSHHPHLDGGYTLFGQVVEGMEVVDALGQDDLILEMRLVDGSPGSPSVR